MIEKLADMLIRHEALKLKPYRDTVGKLTLGVGRNLDDKGITKEEALYLLANDLRDAEADARAVVKCFDDLSEARRAALIDMAFNLGRERLAGFKKTIAAIEIGDFDAAANEMLRSLWAQQVHGRADELAKMIRSGEW